MKIYAVGEELYRVVRGTDRRTDRRKLIAAIRILANAPKTSQLMLYREIIAVCSQIHTKHINTVCGQNVELLDVKLAVNRLFTVLEKV